VAGAADARLIRQTNDGDLDAYAELVDRYGSMAYRVALRLLGSHQDAKDVAQDALVASWQQLPSVQTDASYPAWLYRNVTRRALDLISGVRAASADVVPAAAEAAPENGPGLPADSVIAAVAALPPSQRVAVVLHHFEGLPDQEIARITGSTGPAIRGHLLQGRRALARALQDRRLTRLRPGHAAGVRHRRPGYG
jgi:RNA polymerase sigma-70 factor, ECF subfamily